MLGYAIGRAWWGNGIATEAAGAAMGWAIKTFDLRRIWASTDAKHVRSQRVMRSWGCGERSFASRPMWDVTERWSTWLYMALMSGGERFGTPVVWQQVALRPLDPGGACLSACCPAGEAAMLASRWCSGPPSTTWSTT